MKNVSALSVIKAAGLTNFSHEKFLKSQFAVLPKRFRPSINKRYIQLFESQNFRAANLMLVEKTAALEGKGDLLAASDYELCQHAEKCSKAVLKIALDIKEISSVLYLAEKFARSKFIEPPNPKLKDIAANKDANNRGKLARLLCAKWWRRAIRKSIAREVESMAIDLALVCKQAGIYASDETVARRLQQKKRNRDLLKTIIAINELGSEYTLEALSELNVSNPKLRRAELMTRIAGFDEIAKLEGHAADFYTITCPSKYHAIGYDGKPNPKYEGFNPKQAQAYLVDVWAKFRAYMAKRGIKFYGIRVAEPHHDGTPHWHMVLFYEKKHTNFIRATFRDYCLGIRKPALTFKVSYFGRYFKSYSDGFVKKNTGICWMNNQGGEKGAREHRFKVEAIDRKKGNAAGYLAKYISKNIDAHGFDDDTDFEGGTVTKNVNRVDAWAACWGIRQFQQIGGAPVGVWRELRRLGVVSEGATGILSDLQNACDRANWARYTELQGGALVMRKNLAAKVLRMIFVNKSSLYDGYGVLRVVGVEGGTGDYEKTRLHEWVLKRAGFSPSWSSVNNCNQLNENLQPIDENLLHWVRQKQGEPPKIGEILDGKSIAEFDKRVFYENR